MSDRNRFAYPWIHQSLVYPRRVCPNVPSFLRHGGYQNTIITTTILPRLTECPSDALKLVELQERVAPKCTGNGHMQGNPYVTIVRKISRLQYNEKAMRVALEEHQEEMRDAWTMLPLRWYCRMYDPKYIQFVRASYGVWIFALKRWHRKFSPLWVQKKREAEGISLITALITDEYIPPRIMLFI